MGNRQNSRKQRLETKFAIPQHSGSPKKYEEYTTVMTALVEDVRRKDESRDVADSLRDMQLKDITEVKPVREVSIKKDPEERAIEQRTFDIQHEVFTEHYFRCVIE